MFDKSYSGDAAIAASQSTKEREYWLKKLSGELVKSCFPYDNKESVYQGGEKDRVEIHFGGDLFTRLTAISNRSDTRLLTILAAGLLVLINKYTGSRDIIIGMPIYKQKVEGDFINTALALRCHLQEDMTFKDLLYRVKQAIDEAVKHQNYPIKTLLYDLKIPFSESDIHFPLFDILLMLKNIQDPAYVHHIPANMEFIFERTPDSLEVTVQYKGSLYDKETIERIVGHFSHLLKTAIFNVDLSLAGLDILPAEEKKKLLEEFNHTQPGLKDHLFKTIHRLFEDQVEKTPDRTALVFIRQDQEPGLLTYRQLNEKARRLARILKEKGVASEHIAALLIESSIHMAVAVLAVLKAGGMYLPIDIEAPEVKKTFILKDSGARLVLTGAASDTALFPGLGEIEQLDVSVESLHTHYTQQIEETGSTRPGFQSKPSDPAYIIYTSGSTGRPKGVIVEHNQAVNTLVCRKEEYRLTPGHTALQLFSYAFDGFITSFFTPVISGARVILLCKNTIQDISKIVEVITAFKVTHFISVPVLLQAILTNMTAAEAASLQVVTLAGDKVQPRLVEMAAAKNKNLEIINEYGTTEAAVMSTIYRHQEKNRRVKIGHPIDNTWIYITKSSDHRHPAPIGVFGEMCIAGAGIARGYLNQPELTTEKFLFQLNRSYRSYRTYIPKKLYKTGDLARWLPDGNIEFSGRMDFQVKVRGFRIELGEIERHLLTHHLIKETIVTASENDEGDKYLCAYIVSTRQLSVSELREYLAARLPDYMIPAFFVFLEKLPLSPNGKVDRKQLPPPSAPGTVVEYAPPRDRLEKQLVEIWANVLGIAPHTIGIDSDFFELGGHSLSATILSTRIHKEFNVKIPMVEIFKSPKISSLTKHITSSKKEVFTSISAAEKKEYYPVSSAQKRLYILHQMGFGDTAYNVPTVIELQGELKLDQVKGAFKKMIARYESLRTSIETMGETPVQKILHPSEVEFDLEYHDVGSGSNGQAARAIITHFIRPFDLRRAPLLRAGLMKLEPLDRIPRHVLMVDMHHILTDLVSQSLLLISFISLYNGLQLPELRLQYKDYSEWQQRREVLESLKQQEVFWLLEFEEEIPVLNLPTDYPRPAIQSFEGNLINFEISAGDKKVLNEMAHSEGATLFMLLLAIFNIFLAKLSNQEEIVVGIPVIGRWHANLEQIIGIFLNMLSLKNAPRGGLTFNDFLKQLKEKTLVAYENQNYQFENLVEKVAVHRDTSRNPLFDVTFMFQNTFGTPRDIPEREIQDLKSKPYYFENKTSKYDLTLMGNEAGEKLDCGFEYSTRLFTRETITRFIHYFKHIISSVVANPHQEISQIDIIPEVEKKLLLEDFNNTETKYQKDKTVHQLFQHQVEKTPHFLAVGFEDNFLTYNKLDEESNRLANYLLVDTNIRLEERVGVLMNRSLNIIIAILSILKAGGAYVPIDSSLPEARVKFIIDGAEIGVVISEKEHIKVLNRLQWDCKTFHTFLCLDSTSVHDEDETDENHLMDQEMWHSIGESAEDGITGGGWYSGYTGEPFSKKEMEEYSDNIFDKVTPLLHENSRVLEIGCASGLSMYRIAPRVGFYFGTDLSRVIIEKNKKLVKEGNHQNIFLSCLPAHEIDKLEEENFDIVILNSVIHYFHGHNYLRKVLRKSIDKLGPNGYLFLGDMMDLDLKDELTREMKDFKRANSDKDYRTKTNWSAELFISRAFLEDFVLEVPEIKGIEFSRKIHTLENELTKFRYDALIKIDKSQKQDEKNKIGIRRKNQHDRKTLGIFGPEPLNLKEIQRPHADNLAYVTYTSGTTGVPKGIMIQHRSLSNFIKGITEIVDFKEDDHVLSLTTISFDIFFLEAIVPIARGARVVIGNSDEQLNNTALIAALHKQEISIFQVTPSRLQLLFSDDGSPVMLKKLKYLLVGGEAFPEALLRKARALAPGKICNLYGPTETAIWSTAKDVTGENSLNIGKPIANTQIYILGERETLLPIGVAGELCIGGDGLARGYLNNDKLTGEKFVENPFIPGKRIYKTGDLARWLPDGNLEFIGRLDHQVKIRGFRIELGEIERRLSEMDQVTKVVVVDREEDTGDKCLCAYMVMNEEISVSEARDFLAQTLPAYMIPSYFVRLEEIPLTPNGKIDRKALPGPILPAAENYMPPRDKVEETLARIWCEELRLERVSINANFFHLGGHSLKATMMCAKVSKELNVKVSIIDVFKTPTIRGLSQYIKSTTEDKYESIKVTEVREYYDVTHSQKRLWALSYVKEASLTFNLPSAYLLEGKLNKKAFTKVFETLVERHESLRTVFITVEDEPKQKILSLKETGFALEYIDLREIENKELKAREWVDNELDIYFDLMKGPLLRVKLIRLEEEKYLFLFTMHHIISDNASMGVLFNEILLLYERYQEGKDNTLEPLRIQYKDYAAWQNERCIGEKIKMMKSYWLNQLQGELPVLTFSTDRKRPEIKGYDGDVKGFYLDEELTGQLRSLGQQNDVTLFILLLTAIKVLLYRYTGQTDIIVGTPVDGREHADLEGQIGFYINTLALRTRFSPEETFETLLKKVKMVSLEAYENQVYPFDELIENLGIKRDISRHPIFDVMVNMLKADFFENMPPKTSLQIIPFDSKYTKSKFDLTFYIFEEEKSLKIDVEYNVDLFERESIFRLCKRFQILVNHILKNPGENISDFPLEEALEFSAIRPITRTGRSL
jgi:amino acid adenylation domain-containing protein